MLSVENWEEDRHCHSVCTENCIELLSVGQAITIAHSSKALRGSSALTGKKGKIWTGSKARKSLRHPQPGNNIKMGKHYLYYGNGWCWIYLNCFFGLFFFWGVGFAKRKKSRAKTKQQKFYNSRNDFQKHELSIFEEGPRENHNYLILHLLQKSPRVLILGHILFSQKDSCPQNVEFLGVLIATFLWKKI